MEKNKLCIDQYHKDSHDGQVNFSSLTKEGERVRDDQNYFVIECEIDDEDAIHAIDLFENDDAFLESMGARTEYPARDEKRTHKHYLDIYACFGESMEDKIEGLGELPFPTPSKLEMNWLNKEIDEVNIISQETP